MSELYFSRNRIRSSVGDHPPNGVWQCSDCLERVESSESPVLCEECGGDMGMAPQGRQVAP